MRYLENKFIEYLTKRGQGCDQFRCPTDECDSRILHPPASTDEPGTVRGNDDPFQWLSTVVSMSFSDTSICTPEADSIGTHKIARTVQPSRVVGL